MPRNKPAKKDGVPPKKKTSPKPKAAPAPTTSVPGFQPIVDEWEVVIMEFYEVLREFIAVDPTGTATVFDGFRRFVNERNSEIDEILGEALQAQRDAQEAEAATASAQGAPAGVPGDFSVELDEQEPEPEEVETF